MTNLYSDYPHGFEHGVTIRNIPVTIATNPNGKVFWVDSVNGSDANRGTPKKPFATLAYAITQCTANQGDIIYLAPKHAETIATASGVNFNVTGVTAVFLGEGSDRATITFSTLTSASLNISANNATLINPRFICNIDALNGAILVQAADCTILNGEWYDVPAKACINCIDVGALAARFNLNSWKYFASTTGTQKVYHIKNDGSSNMVLDHVDITGNFSTGNVYCNFTCSDVRLENLKFKNTNATPKPCMDIEVNTTGQAKNVDFRIASGSYYVSSNAKINWDDNCLGYNADGLGGDPIGGPTGGSMEAKIDDIQTDLGDPSARTNLQTIEAILGVPDAANSSLGQMLYTGFDSTAVVPSANGSVMERLEVIQAALTPTTAGYVVVGNCDAGMVASQTSIVVADLGGYGDSFFNTKYYIQVVKNANSVGNAPEREVRKITAYTSATGTFTVDAFSVNVEANDKILVLHESIVMLGRDDADNTMATTNVVANADGSIVEREEYLQTVADAIQVDIGNPSARTNFKSIETMLGIPDAANSCVDDILRTGFDSTGITANVNGSVLELLKYLKDHIVPDMSGLAFSGQCDAAMGASTTIIDCVGLAGYGNDFFNTKYYMVVIKNTNVPGAAPETQIRQITDYDSTLGRFTTNAFGAVVEAADDIMVVYESLVSGTSPIGTIVNTINTNVNTINTNVGDPSLHTFTSLTAKFGNSATTVAADFTTVKTAVAKIDGASLAVSPTAGSIGAFIASGGTALGTQLFDSKSILDAIGSNGNAVNAGVGGVGGQVLLAKAEALKIDSATLVATPTAGSLATFVASGGVALGTPLATSKSLINCLGTDGTTAATATAASAVSLFGAIGTNEVDATTPFSSANVQANADGTVLEREEYIQTEVNKIDMVTLAVAPAAGSLAQFIASGGVALGTPLATSKSLINVLGSDGTTAAAATAASAVSLFGAIGTNETDVTTPFSSANVEANADGTVLEREEYMQGFVAKIDGATLAVSPTAGSLARFIASGGTALGTQLGDSKSIIDALGSNGVVAAAATCASANSLFGAIGTNETDATTPFSSTNVQANADGTVLEREEFIQNAVNKIDSATLAVSPTAGSLAQFIASGGTALGTALAASKSIVDAIGSNGTTLVYGSGSALGAIGTTFWIKKTMTSSNILDSGNTDITGVSSGGELAIEDVIVKTDGTGLATGTNFELLSNNAKGLANIFVETVANLGATKTVDLTGASVTKIRTILESGAKLQVHSTAADCTGAGTIDIYVKFRRLAAGATVAAL
ncbi:MAG: hypothetical protein WC917_00445 [Bacilli bacterium]|jgi:hypothetical protein